MPASITLLPPPPAAAFSIPEFGPLRLCSASGFWPLCFVLLPLCSDHCPCALPFCPCALPYAEQLAWCSLQYGFYGVWLSGFLMYGAGAFLMYGMGSVVHAGLEGLLALEVWYPCVGYRCHVCLHDAAAMHCIEHCQRGLARCLMLPSN